MKVTNSIRSKVLKLAHSISDRCESWGEAQKQAWKSTRAKQAMVNNIVTISFRKANGEITTRIATLDYYILPQVTTVSKAKNTTEQKFWSLTDNAWRAYRPERLISIDKIESVVEFSSLAA